MVYAALLKKRLSRLIFFVKKNLGTQLKTIWIHQTMHLCRCMELSNDLLVLKKMGLRVCLAEGQAPTSENAAFWAKRGLLIDPNGEETVGFFDSNGRVFPEVFGSGG